jgi:hypothetical protein
METKMFGEYNSFLEAAVDFIKESEHALLAEQDEEWITKEIEKTMDYLKAMDPPKTPKRKLPWKTSKDGDM